MLPLDVSTVLKGKAMPAFEVATSFFHACEALAGWGECEPYVAEGATFSAQSEPLVEIETVKEYVDWMKNFGTTTVPGCTYKLHASAYDEASRTAMFFATFIARHGGKGGPVAPTNKQTRSHYVYVLAMNQNNKVGSMQKIWNAAWAMRELGWLPDE